MSTIPFDVPAKFLAGLSTGDIIRFGTILKDSGTGQILGHVQESGMAQAALSLVTSGAPSPLSLVSGAINTGSGLYTAVQVSQLKAMMGALQSLQIATLGVSLVGVGVSVAGFLYMRKRFNLLDGRIDQLIDAVNLGFESQQKAMLRQYMSRTKGLVQRAEQARSLSDPRSEYSEVAARLTDQAAYFEGEISFMISAKDKANLDMFWQLAQVLMLCNSVRIDCRMRTNELRHAQDVSQSIALEYQNLFESITPVSFQGTSPEDGLAMVKVLRDVTDAAASKPYLIDYIRTRRFDGQDYIESLDREKNSPLLILRTS